MSLRKRPYEVSPRLHHGYPVWWHHSGKKMELIFTHGQRHAPAVLIKSPMAQLTIGKTGHKKKDEWEISWKIQHANSGGMHGWVHVERPTLASIFGLNDSVDPVDHTLIETYGGSSARRGIYFRYRQWLNIPLPGTGFDGDLNISLQITELMQSRIREITED